MKKTIETLLVVSIFSMIFGEFVMWYATNYNDAFFGIGLIVYSVSFMGTFVFSATLLN